MRLCASIPLLLLALTAGAPPEVLDLTLQEAIALALRQNREIKALELTLESRRLAVVGARTEFEWTAHPSGNAETGKDRRTVTYGLDVARKTTWGTELTVGGQTLRDSESGSNTASRDTVVVELQQPLLRNAGPLVNREPVTRAESQVAAARRAVELRRTDTVVQVAETFEQLFQLQRQMDYDTQALERLDRFLRLSQAREKNGRVSRVDTLRTEQQRGAASLRLAQTREQWRSVMADLADLLALTPETPLSVQPAPRLTVKVTDEAAAVMEALSNRLDYAQVLHDAQDAKRGVRIARRDLLPDLRVVSRYQRAGDGDSGSQAARLDQNVWFVGLTVAGDLTLHKERIALEEAGVARQTAELNAESLRAALSRQVLQSLLFYNRAQKGIPAAESAYQAARSRVLLARRLFDRGRGTSTTLSDAEDELQSAEVQWLTAQSDASVASYRLLRVLGRLIEYPEDLKPAAQLPTSND